MLFRIVRHPSICYFPSSTNPLDFPLTTFMWTPKSMFFLRRQRYDYCLRSGMVVQQTDLIQYLRTQQLWHVLILFLPPPCPVVHRVLLKYPVIVVPSDSGYTRCLRTMGRWPPMIEKAHLQIQVNSSPPARFPSTCEGHTCPRKEQEILLRCPTSDVPAPSLGLLSLDHCFCSLNDCFCSLTISQTL